MLPWANRELPNSDALERSPELLASELLNDPRIVESVRDDGTILRAIGAFSQI
jgi:hypothetical protein